MAKLNSPFDFSGKFGPFSVYKMHGVDKLVIRRKGGPSKKRIKTDPAFARLRQNNTEFKACTMFTMSVRDAAFLVNHLGDPGYTGRLNSFAKQLQAQDKTSRRGERNICLYGNGSMLAGFNFNKETPFDSLLQHPVAVSANRRKVEATVTIPGLIPGISLNLPFKVPYVRFRVSMGEVGDIMFSAGNVIEYQQLTSGKLQPGKKPLQFRPHQETDWLHTGTATAPVNITVALDKAVEKGISLVLAIGIELGIAGGNGKVQPVRRAGAAKILAVF